MRLRSTCPQLAQHRPAAGLFSMSTATHSSRAHRSGRNTPASSWNSRMSRCACASISCTRQPFGTLWPDTTTSCTHRHTAQRVSGFYGQGLGFMAKPMSYDKANQSYGTGLPVRPLLQDLPEAISYMLPLRYLPWCQRCALAAGHCLRDTDYHASSRTQSWRKARTPACKA